MLYLAMTAAEWEENSSFPEPIGYMACHFSSSGPLLSNLPQQLTPGNMLILSDEIPLAGHDPVGCAKMLSQTAQAFSCSRILLDFQRPHTDAKAMIGAILDAAPCPVGVSQLHAQGFSCPVLLPPLPLRKSPQAYWTPWEDREIWMEAALDAETVTVTQAGAVISPAPASSLALPFFDADLFCHYGLTLSENAAVFTVRRTPEDLQKLMEADPVSCWVGLYQELYPEKGRT